MAGMAGRPPRDRKEARMAGGACTRAGRPPVGGGGAVPHGGKGQPLGSKGSPAWREGPTLAGRPPTRREGETHMVGEGPPLGRQNRASGQANWCRRVVCMAGASKAYCGAPMGQGPDYARCDLYLYP